MPSDLRAAHCTTPFGAVREELVDALLAGGVLVRQDVVSHNPEVGVRQRLRCRRRNPIIRQCQQQRQLQVIAAPNCLSFAGDAELHCSCAATADTSPVRARRRAIGVSVPGPASTGPIVSASGSPSRSCCAPSRAQLESPLRLPVLPFTPSAAACAAGVHSTRSMQLASAGVGT